MRFRVWRGRVEVKGSDLVMEQPKPLPVPEPFRPEVVHGAEHLRELGETMTVSVRNPFDRPAVPMITALPFGPPLIVWQCAVCGREMPCNGASCTGNVASET